MKRNRQYRPVISTDRYGNEKFYQSIQEAATDVGLKWPSGISNACRAGHKCAGRYWRYAGRNMRVSLNEAQWQWVIDRYHEGYTQKSISEFLDMWPNTLFRNLQRLGVILPNGYELEPLEDRRKEFEELGKPKKETPDDTKFRYYT